ncbi:hypothetical protein BMS3Abin03_01995 [bacterium BMS3Abin03]|nr:hypothetical protein BMS3Abin03_01995 [bacterium BMS3Abin03]
MENLVNEINKIELLLKSAYSDLDDISKESFNEKMPRIRGKLSLIVSKRNELLIKYKREKLLKYDESLFTLSKQIQKKFDNIIEYYSAEKLEIAQKILQIENRKKLAYYLR